MTAELIVCIIFILEGKSKLAIYATTQFAARCKSSSLAHFSADDVLLLGELSLHELGLHRAFLLAVWCWRSRLGRHDPQASARGQPRTRWNALGRGDTWF